MGSSKTKPVQVPGVADDVLVNCVGLIQFEFCGVVSSPVATQVAAAPLVRLGMIEFPPELQSLLRYGRGVDTTRIGRTGFSCRYTTAGAVESFIRALRLRRSVGQASPSYTYSQDVEQFFRHSPAVVQSSGEG